MESNENMEDSTTPEGEEVEVSYTFSSEPAVESILITINDKAEYYRLAHGVLTGRYDTDFTSWLANPDKPGSELGVVENLPDTDGIQEWFHLEASLASLLEFKSVLDKLAKELHLAIFGHYAKKNVRRSVEHKLEDLKPLRVELITTLDGTLAIAKTVPMLNSITIETLESLPSVGKRKPFGDNLVWNFPDAPSVQSESDKAAALHGTNLRKNNSTVKFVVDGKLPEEDSNIILGDLCAKYFDKSTQDVGKLFDGWAKEYFAAGDEQPEKAVERKNSEGVLHRYWLTTVGK